MPDQVRHDGGRLGMTEVVLEKMFFGRDGNQLEALESCHERFSGEIMIFRHSTGFSCALQRPVASKVAKKTHFRQTAASKLCLSL